jgi:hypothetical protein
MVPRSGQFGDFYGCSSRLLKKGERASAWRPVGFAAGHRGGSAKAVKLPWRADATGVPGKRGV